MTKTIMIIGAGRGQLGLYQAARKLDVKVIAAGRKGNYPGLDLADECCFVDISNPDAVIEEAKRYQVEAIVTSCMDTGVEAVGAVNDALGLRGVGRTAAVSAFDKVFQKRTLSAAGVPTAKYKEATCWRDIELATKEFGFPIVLKQRRSQGSEGVYIAKDLDTARRIYDARFSSRQDIYLVEEYLDGEEFGAQAMIVDGEVRFVMPHGDVLYMGHAPIPVGHYLPLDQPDDLIDKTIHAAVDAIKASGFNNCAVNIDFRLNQGEINLVELTARAGANGLPELTSAYLGVNYYDQIIRLALGEEIECVPRGIENTVLVKMILPERDGKLRINESSSHDVRVKEIQTFKENGQEVRAFENLGDCIGMITSQGSSLDECLEAVSNQTRRSFAIS